ncbi:MAG: hypothetical protein CFE26_21690 [Verrucomicrobiales bacterium VVV1]|nr:MAG: hypothetical protein CFE26_21690 [Verrucomicrobiales bacterium VVV1]
MVACGWFGIQTWFGGAALHATLAIIFGFDVSSGTAISGLGINAAQLACFLAFWAMNVYFIWKGMESIKWLEALSAPFLLLVGVLLMIWAVTKAGGFGPVFAASSPSTVTTWAGFGAGLTAMVGFWSTLSLNIPDFSRYAKSQRDQIVGQAVALPTTMAFYSFVGDLGSGAGGRKDWQQVAVGLRLGDPRRRHALDQHRRQRRVSGERLLEPRSPSDQLPGRWHDHRCDRHPDHAVEAGGGPRRLHLHLAHRLRRAAGSDRGHHDRRLLRAS